MILYTRTGDEGKTAIIGGRVDKDDLHVETIGTIDEANCFVGQAVAQLDPGRFHDLLTDLKKIQNELFDCGGDLASVTKHRKKHVNQEMIDYLEKRIDRLIDEAPDIEQFILPGGSVPAASLHLARAVTRRAERCAVKLVKVDQKQSLLPLHYLNRLSDYFFAAARVVNYRLNKQEDLYGRSAPVFRGGRRKQNRMPGEQEGR
ncbi:cob(I)yrinic acid a,c-diamide adenosyltransferase [Sporolactobacillus sp. Y61]|uniref:Corrinoid adenosyltransferase n=1 Tax=Sporolactobacillus sp. Y61 TaxID=3160863 RepID=A0AAU8IBI9_9BACL|nr:cob(I)yrinic acid a,c-diamide adenosyltransferase [Sporolactobacillus sp. THM19-2]RYL93596.1 cob(I)yrinic acid a,c-diamide adenosyltransferase [Sporolactobacillus sp. THM19-2]